MPKFFRRHLLLASVVGTTGSLASSAPLSETLISPDEDLLKIKNRLLSLNSRGSTLTVEEKFISLLAVCAAQALEAQAREMLSGRPYTKPHLMLELDEWNKRCEVSMQHLKNITLNFLCRLRPLSMTTTDSKKVLKSRQQFLAIPLLKCTKIHPTT